VSKAHQPTDADVALALLDVRDERDGEAALPRDIREAQTALGAELAKSLAEMFG
jgi:hypothetical protein